MAENSKIAWTDHTANLWWGCTKVRNNPLCDNCYANVFAKRVGNDIWGDDTPRRAIKDVWGKLDKWQQQANKVGKRYRVFTMSMGDIFERDRPLVNHKGEPVEGSTAELRSRLFGSISNARYPSLDFQMLTKRPQNVMRMVPSSWHTDWPSNVWIGTSIGDQANADRNIPELLKIPSTVRFLSMEPLLEAVNLGERLRNIQWIIVGGESGHGARPMLTSWALYIKRQCDEHGVPFFFKQGSQANWIDYKGFDLFPSELQCRQFPYP